MINKYLLIFFIGIQFFSNPILYAQQDVHFTNYQSQGILHNPSYAGSKNGLEASLSHRKQWVNLVSSPSISSFNIHTAILHQSGGLGFYIVNQQLGSNFQTSLMGNFSYRIRFYKGTLACGLETGFRYFQSSTSNLLIYDLNDPLIHSNSSSYIPDLGIGSYYQTEKLHIGFSLKKINSFRYQTTSIYRQIPYLSFFGRKKLKFVNNNHLIFSSLIHYNNFMPLLAEATFIFHSHRGIYLGMGARSSKEIAILIGFHLKEIIPVFQEDIRIGYSFDYGFSALQSTNNGSHECIITYKLIRKPSPEQILKQKRAIHPIFF